MNKISKILTTLLLSTSPLLSSVSCGNKNISYVLVSPSGNDTAVVEINHNAVNAKRVNDAIMQKESSCEQTVFINNLDTKNKYVEMEMGGDEFCGNAARAVMYYLHDKYNWDTATLEYKDYGFKMQGKILPDEFSQITAAKNKLILGFSLNEKYKNLTKVVLSGITHYVVLSNCELYQYKDNFEFTKSLIKNELVTPNDKSVGVMYWTPQTVLKPYVYVKDVDTMFNETACGSGTIATAFAAWYHFLIPNEFPIMQPSGKELTVILHDEDLSLKGVCSIINKGTILI